VAPTPVEVTNTNEVAPEGGGVGNSESEMRKAENSPSR